MPILIRTVINHNPFARELNLQRYSDDDPNLPWRTRLAWWLRRRADRIDSKVSYAISGILPSGTNNTDLWDAMAFGIGASQTYLAELAKDRSLK